MSPAKTTRALLPCLLAVVLAILAPGGAALAQTAANTEGSVAWSVRPADTAQGRDRPNFAYEVAPGTSVSDALTVTNRSAEPIELDVYAADGFLTPDGSLDILASSEPSTELGSWISVASAPVALASGESTEVPFRLDVPADATPGDYAAGVVAAMLVTADSGTVTERRLGSRIHLRVQGELAPALTVSDVAVDYHGTINPAGAGSATVRYRLTNEGNTRLRPEVEVTAAGPFGWAAVRATDEAPELLPRSSIERSVTVEGVPPLIVLTAEARATSTVVSPGVTPTIEVPEPIVSTGSAATAAVPWSALVIVLALAALVFWRLRARRKARTAQQRAIDEAVAAARAELVH